MWLFPGLSYFAVMGIAAVLVAMGMIPDLQSQLTTTLLLIVFLLVIYFVFRRGRYVAAEASQA
jgi:L-asparagine transporter-like permease